MRGFSDNLQAIAGFYARDGMKRLLGRKLRSVELADDKSSISFVLDDGSTQEFGVEGDCCSSSWIEHLESPGDVGGATVTNVTEELMDETEKGYEHIKSYQTTFVTDRGGIVLEYRNSSNGYYGGYLTDLGFTAVAE